MIRFDVFPRRGSGVRRLLALGLMLATAGQAQAGGLVYTWPGAAPCNGTLQACITATTNGSTIEIVTAVPIAETLNIQNRSFTLRAAEGVQARFAPGHNLFVGVAPISANVQVTLDGLQLTDGYVSVGFNNAGTGTFVLRGLTLRQSSPSAPPAYIAVSATAGTVDATLADNRVDGMPTSLNGGLLWLSNRGAVLNAKVYYNRVSSPSTTLTDGAGIFIDAVNGASGRIRVHGNTVRGGFLRAGIYASEGLFSTSASDYEVRAYSNVVIGVPGGELVEGSGSGIGFTARTGRISAQAINNTITRLSNGISALRWQDATDTAEVEGVLSNNVIVARRGLLVSADLATSPSNDYNLINAVSNIATLGAHTITAPAALVSADTPRLRDGSPAIDAADTTLLGLGIIVNALPLTDADGLRRIKGASPAKADIGAYEWGDSSFAHVARAENSFAHITRLSHPALDAAPDAFVFTQPARNQARPPSVDYDAPHGVFYQTATSRWAVFSQNFATMPIGARFHVFVPAPGGGLLRHEATADTLIAGQNYTRVDAPGLDNLADRVVIVTQNHEPNHVYNAHPIGTFFNGSTWFIDNVDDAEMPVGASFNVYYQEPSPNAFHVRPQAGAETVVLRHPLLDGNACARPLVTRQYEGTVGAGYRLRYADGGWSINAVGGAFDDETTFHVLVDAPRADPCDPPLFADGFESG